MEELQAGLTEFSTFWRLCYTQNLRLIKKAKKILVYTQSTASVQTIDELVMTFDQLTFVRKECLTMFNDIHARRSRTGRHLQPDRPRRSKFQTFARELNTDEPGWNDVAMETSRKAQACLYELFGGFVRVLCSRTCCIRRFQEVSLTATLQQRAHPPARLRDGPPRHRDAR